MCNNWPDYPIDLHGATGGLIGNTVIICGGSAEWNGWRCYSMTSEKVTQVTYMSNRRQYAASIVLNDDTLWVTGGYGRLFDPYFVYVSVYILLGIK